jgi:aminoglycoside/choline kinase family phosphotransferase
MQDALARLFEQTFGRAPQAVSRVAADGSQRTYYRLTGGPHGTVVGAQGPDAEENRAFLSFTHAFRAIGLPVPELYGADEAAGLWLEEDLGDTTLFAALTHARAHERGAFPEVMTPVYERVVDVLPRFQIEGGRAVDFSLAYPRAAFDLQSMRWDMNYFKYHFLKLAHVPFSEQRLENDFDRLTAFLLRADTSHFLYRDFQSRNIMLREGEPWFIDYQGGRRGAPQYDIASLLYDAKAALPDEVREHLLGRYVRALSSQMDVNRDTFIELYRGYVLIRIMQAMGAYGYRGFFERKPRFLESVPHAAANIARIVDAGLPVQLPEIEAVFRRIVDAWAGRPVAATLPGLTVRVSSFSYRHGYPEDETGHGGGYVFDCRALPNPGRQPEFAQMSGLDAPVVAYLEDAREMEPFFANVRALVDRHVDDFRHRAFTDVSVAFGCTGGQHRSVYFAERLAKHVRERFPDVRVRVEHRARGSWPPAAQPRRAAAATSPAPAAGSWTP